MKKPRILAFSASLRALSFNQQLASIVAQAARDAGAEVTLISLRDFRMPLFDEELEANESMAEGARNLKTLFAQHDGLIIASPEHNGSFTAAFKNAIDWISRPTEAGEPALLVLKGKTAAICSASPGGSSRGLAHLRSLLNNISISVVPEQIIIPTSHAAFASDGSLLLPEHAASAKALGAALVAAMTASAQPREVKVGA